MVSEQDCVKSGCICRDCSLFAAIPSHTKGCGQYWKILGCITKQLRKETSSSKNLFGFMPESELWKLFIYKGY